MPAAQSACDRDHPTRIHHSAIAMSSVRVLALAAGRGGTGKSTLAFGIADEIRRLDERLDVALVDLDPQAGLTGYAKLAPSANPVLDEPAHVHGLTLYRGGRALAHATEADIGRHVERALAGGPADRDRVLVVDMAPALTDAAHRAVFARDDVMLVGAIKTEPGSFQSLNELVAYVSKRGLPYVLVPTIHRSVLLNNTMLLTMRQQHEGHVSDAVFPLDGKAAECVVAGQPVTMYAKRSKAAKAVAQLVEELFGTAPDAALAPAVVEPPVVQEVEVVASKAGRSRPKAATAGTAAGSTRRGR